ncbi:hypothetical protein LC724_06750 [Blautia sp. RD014234]|nr:hypothetical protein [Blautia parvula]
MAMLFLLILGIVGSIVLMILSGAAISEISSVLSGFCVTVGILDPLHSQCMSGRLKGHQPQ